MNSSRQEHFSVAPIVDFIAIVEPRNIRTNETSSWSSPPLYRPPPSLLPVTQPPSSSSSYAHPRQPPSVQWYYPTPNNPMFSGVLRCGWPTIVPPGSAVLLPPTTANSSSSNNTRTEQSDLNTTAAYFHEQSQREEESSQRELKLVELAAGQRRQTIIAFNPPTNETRSILDSLSKRKTNKSKADDDLTSLSTINEEKQEERIKSMTKKRKKKRKRKKKDDEENFSEKIKEEEQKSAAAASEDDIEIEIYRELCSISKISIKKKVNRFWHERINKSNDDQQIEPIVSGEHWVEFYAFTPNEGQPSPFTQIVLSEVPSLGNWICLWQFCEQILGPESVVEVEFSRGRVNFRADWMAEEAVDRLHGAEIDRFLIAVYRWSKAETLAKNISENKDELYGDPLQAVDEKGKELSVTPPLSLLPSAINYQTEDGLLDASVKEEKSAAFIGRRITVADRLAERFKINFNGSD